MQNHVTIRGARPGDANHLVEFNLKMASETENKKLDPDVLAAGVDGILKDPACGFYLVAEIEGEVGGCLMVTTEWSDWRNGMFWWIQSVYVLPGFRRRGVFRALYDEARKRARSSTDVCGCRLYVEQDNAPAQAVYTRLGLKKTSYDMFEELFE